MSTYLDEPDRDKLRLFLSHPIFFPPEFESWLSDYLATNIPKLPISQVFGFKVDKAEFATEITAAETSTSTSYGNLTTAGPTLSRLANGFYLVIFGCRISGLGAGNDATTRGHMSLSLNGVTPSDNDQAYGRFNPISRATLVHVTNNDVNEIKAQYKKSGAGASVTFERRYMAALRVISTDV